jgi:hypothetical protein
MALQKYDLRVGGVEINNHAYAVDVIVNTGFAARAQVGVVGANVDGVTTPLGRFVTPPSFTISMWISGYNADGSKPTDEWAKLQANYEAILAAFTPYGPTVPIVMHMPDGTDRTCDARIMASMTPVMPAPGSSNPVIRCQWVMDIPAIFWRKVGTPATFTTSSTTLTAVTTLAGATAPITDAVFRVSGPIVNPRITNAQGGFCALQGTVAAGAVWEVDSGAFSSWVGSTPVMKDTDYYHEGSSYLMELNRPYQVKLTGTGTTAATKLEVVATPKYLS